jgi:hypothetical protein
VHVILFNLGAASAAGADRLLTVKEAAQKLGGVADTLYKSKRPPSGRTEDHVERPTESRLHAPAASAAKGAAVDRRPAYQQRGRRANYVVSALLPEEMFWG